VPISELTSLLAVARTRAPTPAMSDRQRRLAALRAELPVDDRILLILRIDRELAWDQIALAFVDSPGRVSEADRKREAARLRKRFQLTKQRLVAQARALDLAML
jgi:RNA polymerase sigma-70 factor (ECF subfamily)